MSHSRYCGALRPNFIEKLAIINAPHVGALRRNLSGDNKEVSRWDIIKQLFMFHYIAVITLPWPFYTIWLTWRNYEVTRTVSADHGKQAKADYDFYASAAAMPSVTDCVHAYYKSLFGPLDGVDKSIPVPTIVIWGNRDIALHEPVCLSGLEDLVED